MSADDLSLGPRLPPPMVRALTAAGLCLALGLSSCAAPDAILGTGWDTMKQDAASGVSNAGQLAATLASTPHMNLPASPPPAPWTIAEVKGVLVATRGTWILADSGPIREARIGGLRTDWLGDTIVCTGLDLKDASGRYAGLRPRNVVIAPDHATVSQVYAPTTLDPCSLEAMQPFPELTAPPIEKRPAQASRVDKARPSPN